MEIVNVSNCRVEKAIFDRNLKFHWNETNKKDIGEKKEWKRWCIDRLKISSEGNSSAYNDLLSMSIPKVSYKTDPIFFLGFLFFKFHSISIPFNNRREEDDEGKSYFTRRRKKTHPSLHRSDFIA